MIPGVLAVALLVALLVWFLRPKRRVEPEWGEPDKQEPLEREELEAAEREVRDLELDQRPEDGFDGDDWGPGAAKGER